MQDDEVVYVGKCINGEARVLDHKKDKNFNYYSFLPLGSESGKELEIMEAKYILKYLPKLNKAFGRGYDGGYTTISAFAKKMELKVEWVKIIIEKYNIPEIQVGRYKRYMESDLLEKSSNWKIEM
jgi:hypothetical protein